MTTQSLHWEVIENGGEVRGGKNNTQERRGKLLFHWDPPRKMSDSLINYFAFTRVIPGILPPAVKVPFTEKVRRLVVRMTIREWVCR